MATIPAKTTRTRRTALCMLAVAIFVIGPVSAAPLTEDEVRTAVTTWVRHVTADARPGAVIKTMEPYVVDNQTAGYIAHLSAGGFCLCGADDLVLPVYLYSPHGTYDTANPNYDYILWEIDMRTKALRAAVGRRDPRLQRYQPALTERAAFWADLTVGRVPVMTRDDGDRAAPTRMELPLTCKWDQGSPYNDDCPAPDPNTDQHTVVGCTATATCQLMYYWKWPLTGVGSDHVDYSCHWQTSWIEEPLSTDPNFPGWWWAPTRLEWTPTNGGRLRMNGYWDDSVFSEAYNHSDAAAYRNALFMLWLRMNEYTSTYYAYPGMHTYDWSILQDQHADPPDSSDDAVAELCYDVAVCVHMDFGLLASGASTSNVPGALESHFRYDPDGTSGGLSTSTMINEIQWLRPVIMHGFDRRGGHAWVVYGYDTSPEDPQFLMNMGWGGGGDDWYSCDKIGNPDPNDPNDFPWFDSDQGQVYRLAPLDVVQFVNTSGSGDGSPDNSYGGIEEAIAEAPDGTTLIFKAGSVNTFAVPNLVIDRPLTLKGYDVTID